MCGIYGWDMRSHLGAKGHKGLGRDQRIALCIGLALENDRRGGDSWGIFHPDRTKGERIVKGLGTAVQSWDALALPAEGLAGSQRAIGHTRFGTHGEKNDIECAHPFHIGGIVGCHNGVLSNHTELNKKYGRDFKVDSQHLIAHLAEERTAEDWLEIHGYGLLCWWDEAAPGRINFLRFNNGEICVATIEGGGTIWSSNQDHLKRAVSLAGLTIKTIYKTEEDVVHFVDDDGYFYSKDSVIKIGSRGSAKNWNAQIAPAVRRGQRLALEPNDRLPGETKKQRRIRLKDEREKTRILREEQIKRKGYACIVNGRVDTQIEENNLLIEGEHIAHAAEMIRELRYMVTMTDEQLVKMGYSNVDPNNVLDELMELEMLWPELAELTSHGLTRVMTGGSPDAQAQAQTDTTVVELFEEGGDASTGGADNGSVTIVTDTDRTTDDALSIN